MNKKIIAILHPFEYKHFIYVYQDGNKIDMAKVLIDDVPDNIITFAEKYEINKIELSGPKQYARGIQNKIQECEITKYGKSRLNIELI